MRIVLLITDLEPGGAPLRIARLARDMAASGVEVHVGCLAPPGPISRALEADGVPTFACNARGPRDLLTLRRLSRNLKRIRPDLIHATLTHANVAARLAGRRLRIPVLTSTATIEVERRWHLTVERCTANMDRGHLVNSRAVARHVTHAFKIPPERVHLVPPSADIPRQMPDRAGARRSIDADLPPESFVILWAGRFDPVKRIDIVVRCVERIADRNCRLLLVGDGPERTRIESLVYDSPARDRIHLLGWRDDLSPAFAAADLLLFPSLTEGMPNVVLQAMAAGVPVVGGDIPALRELDDGQQRLVLVKDRSRPATDEAYAAAADLLMRDAAARNAMSARAAAWAREHLDPARVLSAVLKIYRQTLDA